MKTHTAIPTQLWRLDPKDKLSAQESWLDDLEDRLGVRGLYTPHDTDLDLQVEPGVVALRQEFQRLKEMVDGGWEHDGGYLGMVRQSLHFASYGGEENGVMAAQLLGIRRWSRRPTEQRSRRGTAW